MHAVTGGLLIACALVTPAALRSEEPDDVLWMSSVEGGYPFAAQLHRGGYAWVLLSGATGKSGTGEGGRAQLNVALRRPPQLYDQLHSMFRAAGVERGVTLELGPELLLGIAPIRLKGPEPESRAGKELIGRFRNGLCPPDERWADGWKRILDATNTASAGKILTETGRLEVTLAGRDIPAQIASKPDELVSPGLVQALIDGPWSDSASRISYVVEFEAFHAHRVLVTFPEQRPVLVNGKELESDGLFRRTPSTAPDTMTMAGQLGGRDVRFHPRQGPFAHVWIYRATTLWFPAALWADRPDIEVRYALSATDVVQARLRPSDQQMRICANQGQCSTVDLEDARGLAARALGECRASLRELGRTGERNHAQAPRLSVRVAGHTCSLGFDNGCLRARRPGLDLVIEDLRARTVKPTRFSTASPEYPTCERAPASDR